MLEVKNVSAGYNESNVIFDISFSLKKGERVGIIGPNGCGKTTLLRSIADLIPFDGDVLIEGRSVKSMKRKELALKIALLSQLTQLNFTYSVYDTVMMGRYPHQQSGFFSDISDKDKAVVESSLKSVHMWDTKDRDINTLSGGQLQRVFLAKTLAQQPEIILLDEPTNHLDLSYQVELIELLKDWSVSNGTTLVGVLHDLNLAMDFADTLLLMDKGRLVAQGDSAEIISSPILEEVYKMDISGYMVQTLERWKGGSKQ